MKMKSIIPVISVLLLAGIIFTGCGTTSGGGTNPSITLVNRTGFLVHYVFMSPVTDDSWGSDWLDRNQVLKDRESVTLQLDYPLSQANRYDIKLRDSDGDDFVKMNVTIRNGIRIVFTIDDLDVERYLERTGNQ